MIQSDRVNRYINDERDAIRVLVGRRVPILIIGLLLGFIISFMTSRFDEVLIHSVEVAFFIPFVVYIAAAVGSQTQNIYIRALNAGKAKFNTYLLKEGAIGVLLGVLLGLVTWGAVMLWLGDMRLALAVGLSTLGAIITAPFVALLVTELLELEHQDPAIGTGPIATVLQDTVSIVIYGIITSLIILP